VRTIPRALFQLAAVACIAMFPCLANAQSPDAVRIRGSFQGTGTDGFSAQVSFSCTGMNPCAGNYTATFKELSCSNAFSFAYPLVITGLDLSRTGPIAGTVSLGGSDYDTQHNPDGTCSVITVYATPPQLTFTGTWDGTRATMSLTNVDQQGSVFTATGTLTKDAAIPVFPMVVTSHIDPVSATATAAIQYRPEDVGTSGSVYTFAMAPSTLVRPAPAKDALEADSLPPLGFATKADGTKDTAVACVLAQLNSSGQLQAVSASSLQAYVTGVLSSQGQAVNVINGVATANIGGATFYVGYGTSSTAMINNGINRNVVAVPGALECKPQAPQTGWWWNAAESGRGYTIEATGNKLFIAAYLYDVTGRSTWYISAGPTSLDGSLYTGNLELYSGGQTLTGAYKAPTLPPTIAGTISLAFSDAYHGTLVWPGGTVAINRYEYGTGGVNAVPQANQPENGWWWNAAESGRGYFIEWQAGTAVMAGYLYEADGHSVWYYAAAQTPNAQALSTTWTQYADGQTMTGPYKPATQVNPNVGAVTIQFQGAQDGIMTLPGGRKIAIARYRF
jgi:hypothetical protein